MARLKSTQSKKILFIALLALILASGATAYALFRLNSSESTTGDPKDQTYVDYGPPTEQEKSAGDTQKDINIRDTQNEKTPSAATVVISDASQYDDIVEVRAFVSNVIESGTCTTTLSKGSQSVSKSTVASADATTSICGRASFNRSELNETGSWKVSVTYQNQNKTLRGSANSSVDVK